MGVIPHCGCCYKNLNKNEISIVDSKNNLVIGNINIIMDNRNNLNENLITHNNLSTIENNEYYKL